MRRLEAARHLPLRQDVDLRLIVEQILFEVSHLIALFHRVRFVKHLFVKIDLGLVFVMGIILSIDRLRQEFLDVKQRVDKRRCEPRRTAKEHHLRDIGPV